MPKHATSSYFGDHLPEANCKDAGSWDDTAKTPLVPPFEK